MMPRYSPEEQCRRTLHAMQLAELDVRSVWIRYFSLSGDADEFEVDAYLNGLINLTPLDRDLVSHAVNELISETPRPAAPYSNGPDEPEAVVALGVQGVLADLARPDDPRDPGSQEGPGSREDDLNEDGREPSE
ncbi:hypothetical protein ACX80H_09160 [Arthrobacter sp. MDT2-2]